MGFPRDFALVWAFATPHQAFAGHVSGEAEAEDSGVISHHLPPIVTRCRATCTGHEHRIGRHESRARYQTMLSSCVSASRSSAATARAGHGAIHAVVPLRRGVVCHGERHPAVAINTNVPCEEHVAGADS